MKNKTATECWNILIGELDSARYESKLEVHRQIYVDQCKRVNNILTKTKSAYYSNNGQRRG